MTALPISQTPSDQAATSDDFGFLSFLGRKMPSPVRADEDPTAWVNRDQEDVIWESEAFQQLRMLEDTPVDWHDDPAASIKTDSIEIATAFLAHIARPVLPRPRIAVSRDGFVVLTFETEDFETEYEVLANGSVRYVYLDLRDESRDREGRTADWRYLTSLVSR